MDAITIAVIAGSLSTHITTDYAPANGYNESHRSIGVEVVQDKDGLTHGGQAFKFKDSFNENSFSALYSLGYTKRFKTLSSNIRAGLAGGYVSTSYYDGVVAMPFVGGYVGRVGVDVSFIPKVTGGDSVVMAQFKFKLN